MILRGLKREVRKMKNEWRKRKIRYFVNNNISGKIFMKLYYEFEELIWLGISVGIFVSVLAVVRSVMF